MKPVLISFVILIYSLSLSGQHYFMEILTPREGMPASQIWDIKQDSAGYIWLLSFKGITRYDGTRYAHYDHEVLGNENFPGSAIRKMYSDDNGGIWTTTASGAVLSYDPLSDRFEIRNDTLTRLPSEAYSYFKDKNGVFWFGTAGAGLIRWDEHQKSVRQYKAYDHADSIPDNFISTILPANDSLLLLTTTKGNAIFDPASGRFYRLWFNASDGETYKHNVIRHSLDHQGKNYTGSYWGLHITDLETLQTVHLTTNTSDRSTLNHNSIWKMVPDHLGRIWIATYGGGVNIYDPKSEMFTYLTKENSDLPENNVQGIFRDREGSMWIRTASSGLAKIDFRKQWIRHINTKAKGITTNPMSALAEGDSVIWIGTNGDGLIRYDLTSDVYKQYLHDPDDPTSLGYNHIAGMDMDQEGTLWLATAGNGMDAFDPQSEEFRHFPYEPDDRGVSNAALSHIYCDGKRVYFVTFGNGFGIYDKESGRIKSYQSTSETGTATPIENTNVVFGDSRNNIWILTDGGIIIREPGDSVFYDVVHSGMVESPFSSLDFTTITELSEGSFFISNSNGETAFLEYQGKGSVSYLHTVRGDDKEFETLYYSDSIMWSLTSGGLLRRDFRTGTEVLFDEKDGMLGNEFYGMSGKKHYPFLITTVNGLNIINPENAPGAELKPRVLWDRLTVLNQPVPVGSADSVSGLNLPHTLNYTKRIALDYGHKEFTISYSSLQFYSPDASSFRYRLRGFTDDWVEAGNQKKVSYTNLDPGDYSFEVQASLFPGEWGAVKSLDIHINPPFWMTWWFILIISGVFMGLLYLFHTYRVQKAVAVANLRTQIAQDLHDDIGSSLTKISLYSSLIDEEENSEQGIAAQIGELSREVITQMSDIIWSVDQKHDSVGDLVARMRQYAEGTLGNCGIELLFRKDLTDDKILLNPLVRQNYYLIFKEAVNNICKHSGSSHAWISLKQRKGQLTMEISDDGIGLNGIPGKVHNERVNANSSGNGLGNMKKRAERIRQSIIIEDRQEGGTRIILGNTT